MIELSGQAAELIFTLEITRAATGETETVELIGKLDDIDNRFLSPDKNDSSL